MDMIQVKDLKKTYQNIEAVRGISFSVAKGEVVGILGPNGAGKSSTIRILCGFLSPSSGEVVVGGQPFVAGQEMVGVKKMIGYLPESAPAYYEMIVYDFLRFIYNVRGGDAKQAHAHVLDVIARCGLVAMKHKNIADLSKGYRQRVGLAQALIGDPEILVLDEPTSGLDPNQIVEIRSLIRAIGKKKTVLLCSHILSEVEATCDRVIIIKDGLIVADDAMENLKKRHNLNQTLQLAFSHGDANVVRESLRSIAGADNVENYATSSEEGEKAFGFHVRYKKVDDEKVRQGKDMRAQIFALIKEKNWALIEFQQRVESLESIFRELTIDASKPVITVARPPSHPPHVTTPNIQS